MEEKTIDLLVTTMNKNPDEVKDLVRKNGLKGHVIVGNQNGEDSRLDLTEGETSITLSNLSSVGVSKNRNALLNISKADYVLFLDDDMTLKPNYPALLLQGLQDRPKAVAIHFNIDSANPKRPIPQHSKSGRLTFKKTTSLGVVGMLVDRRFVLDCGLSFDEKMGPGTTINHGEDTVFYHDLFKKTKQVYCDKNLLGTASQEISTWWGKSQKENLVGLGYMYRRMFGHFAFLYVIYHTLKHRSHYRDMSWTASLKAAREGIHLADRSN